jgi:hypothetical protein
VPQGIVVERLAGGGKIDGLRFLDIKPIGQQDFAFLWVGNNGVFTENANAQGEFIPIAPRPAGGIEQQSVCIIVGSDEKILTRHQTKAGFDEAAHEM